MRPVFGFTSFDVSALELGDLAVLQDHARQIVLVSQRFERGGIGRARRLGALERLEAALVEQDRFELAR
jgi:hypothetical protein